MFNVLDIVFVFLIVACTSPQSGRAGCARYSKEQEQDMQAVRDAVSADPAKLNASRHFSLIKPSSA